MPLIFSLKNYLKLPSISKVLLSGAGITLSLVWTSVYFDCVGSDICAYLISLFCKQHMTSSTADEF